MAAAATIYEVVKCMEEFERSDFNNKISEFNYISGALVRVRTRYVLPGISTDVSENKVAGVDRHEAGGVMKYKY